MKLATLTLRHAYDDISTHDDTLAPIPASWYSSGMAEPGTLLAQITPDRLVERVANGESPIKIADELGVTRASVYYHLVDHPGYKPARKLGMTIRLDQAENDLITAPDQLSVSRGREVFRAVAWRAEREHPDAWGAVSKLTGADGGPLQVQIVRFGSTLEGEVVSSEPQKALEPPK